MLVYQHFKLSKFYFVRFPKKIMEIWLELKTDCVLSRQPKEVSLNSSEIRQRVCAPT